MAAMLSWAATVYPMDGTWVPIIWDPNTPLEDTMDDDSHGFPTQLPCYHLYPFLSLGMSHGYYLGKSNRKAHPVVFYVIPE